MLRFDVLNALRHHSYLHDESAIAQNTVHYVLNALRHHSYLHKKKPNQVRGGGLSAQRLTASQLST